MQAGDVIWLLAGIGIGLTAAMLILAAVLVLDGQRFKRRLAPVSGLDDPAPRPPAAPKRPPVPIVARSPSEDRPRPASPPSLPAVPPAPTIRTREPIVADPSPEPVGTDADETLSDLAAEIARVQSPEPVVIELPAAPEPVRVVAEPVVPPPTPAPEVAPVPPPPPPVAEAAAKPVSEPTVTAEAPPLVLAPVLPPVPPPPKVPPLPKVTPARKFAPALPPRQPPKS